MKTAAISQGRRLSSATLLTGILLLGLYRWWFNFNISPSGALVGPSTSRSSSKEDTWQYIPSRDADNYGLSESQCNRAFPKMYAPINDMVATYQNSANTTKVTKEHLATISTEMHQVKAMIHNGHLYIITDLGLYNMHSRGMATALALHRALIAYPDRASLPDIEFVLGVWDKSENDHGQWTYTKQKPFIGEGNDRKWLMPDFGMFDWPERHVGSYSRVREEISAIEEELPFEQKIPQIVWRGGPLAGQQSMRSGFVEATNGREWADVKTLDWQNTPQLERDILNMWDMCRYQFTGHVQGVSWSGAAKYIHNCDSVFVTHEIEWSEIYHGALVSEGPEQNYVACKQDWSDLDTVMRDLLDDPAKAKRIARNSVETLRDQYLTPAAEACYWRALIRGYGEVSERPDFYKEDGKTKRGVHFEDVQLMRKLDWDLDAP